MQTFKHTRIAIAMLGCILAELCFAQAPQLMNYQGYLTDPATGLAKADGSYQMVFSIYNAPTGGSAIWTETQLVKTQNGLYSVLLGSTTPLAAAMFTGAEKYLGLKVGDDAEMVPRKRIVSVAYALMTEQADKLDGKDATDFAGAGHLHDDRYVEESQADAITSSMIRDGTITGADIAAATIGTNNLNFTPTTRPLTPGLATAEIADSAVTSIKIKDATVTGVDIAAGAIRVNQLQNNAVTSAKIQDATIIGADIAAQTIGTSNLNFTPATRPLTPGVSTAEIMDNAVTGAKIQDGTITSADIAAQTIGTSNLNFTPATRPLTPGVSTAEIADNAVTSAKIQDGTITGGDIAAAAIGTNQLQNDAVTSAKIQDGTITGGDIAPATVGASNLNFTPVTRPLTPGVSNAEILNNAVDSTKIAVGAVTSTRIQDGTIRSADIATNAAIAESKLALNFPTHSNANDPSTGEKAALVGTNGTPSSTNRYVTNSDPRNIDPRTPSGAASGDLLGTYPNPTVAKLQTRTVSSTAPATGQVLKWDGTQWRPDTDAGGGPPTGTAGGDLTGTYPNPTIANDAVNSAKILNGTIANADIAANAAI
ncbi:MAG: hypothetical protein ACREOI_28740, partial [bacterium]